MLYYDNEWKICPFIAHYKAHGKPEFKYTNDKQWWIEFVNRWWHHTDLSFTDVNPTQAQQTRLDEVNTAPIPEGFQAEASAYVESGLIVNSDNPHFIGFTQWPEALEDIKAEIKLQVNEIRYSKIYQDSIPYTFLGDTEPDGIQMRDEKDRQNIQDFVIDATTKDHTTEMTWMPVSNTPKTLTAAQAIEMGQILKARGDSIMAYSWQLKGQIDNAETIAELEAINITDGWPE